MNRSDFLRNSSLLGVGLFTKNLLPVNDFNFFPKVRIPFHLRKFHSQSIEAAIKEFGNKVKNKELVWFFENCFPNSLDVGQNLEIQSPQLNNDSVPRRGYSWLLESTLEVWPYLEFLKDDVALQKIFSNLIRQQAEFVLSYCSLNVELKKSFSPSKSIEGHSHCSCMADIGPLCFYMLLSSEYYEITKDKNVINEKWYASIRLIYNYFRWLRHSIRKAKTSNETTNVDFSFQYVSQQQYDSEFIGLIPSMRRPSGGETIYPYIIPSNLIAATALEKISSIIENTFDRKPFSLCLKRLAIEVKVAIEKNGIVNHSIYGKIYAYETDGFGSYHIMDDPTFPSLLSLQYFNIVGINDAVYNNTRKLLLSSSNPYFVKANRCEGISCSSNGMDLISTVAMIMQAFSSKYDSEINKCLKMLIRAHRDRGLMQEYFHKESLNGNFAQNPWINSLFGNFLWKKYRGSV